MSIVYERFGVKITEHDDETATCERVCPFCGQNKSIDTTINELCIVLFKKRGLEHTNPSLREMFISGICDECWPDEPDE